MERRVLRGERPTPSDVRIAVALFDSDKGFLDADDKLGFADATLGDLLMLGLCRDGSWYAVPSGGPVARLADRQGKRQSRAARFVVRTPARQTQLECGRHQRADTTRAARPRAVATGARDGTAGVDPAARAV